MALVITVVLGTAVIVVVLRHRPDVRAAMRVVVSLEERYRATNGGYGSANQVGIGQSAAMPSGTVVDVVAVDEWFCLVGERTTGPPVAVYDSRHGGFDPPGETASDCAPGGSFGGGYIVGTGHGFYTDGGG